MVPTHIERDPASFISRRVSEGFRVEMMGEVLSQKTAHLIEITLAKGSQIVDDHLKLSGGVGWDCSDD